MSYKSINKLTFLLAFSIFMGGVFGEFNADGNPDDTSPDVKGMVFRWAAIYSARRPERPFEAIGRAF